MRILVTGGAGFIGGHLAESFLADGHDVTVLDSLEPFYAEGIKRHTLDIHRDAAGERDARYRFVEGDVRDPETVRSLVADADVVFHQAAQAGVRASVDHPRKVTDINVDGTVNLLEASKEADVRRVVLASSSSVYGKPESLPYAEDHPTEPVSPYGVTKLAQEHLARVYAELHGLPTVCLRYFTVYGPRMRPNMAISNFVSRCLNGEPPVIYGDGRQTRDFTYVADVVDANRTLLNSGAADGEVLNVGSSDNVSIRELAETVRDRLAPELDITYESAQEADAEHTHASVEKAGALIGYEPSRTILEGVEEFIEWYRANREWYEPLVRSS
ncbi:NAD-dependent epimerase/dehydratase family protein [Halorubrum lipolyticum]|uniref:Nucleoside-diphosphate-sugar epimerase (UDP-glucose 4-epimerase) n=1 Tax=Halorubrum lipolyticum DSM 21995 TaxID=1227482 RepID=M0NZ04_9EURY|nr:NAD-dependent epimerase/dehydratase family protein [Halorubrum lipolyticum]EMA63041.1 nucleoside-diphosphate-sugar epimerase (UDP-glucose 4-epimerase) [Halorubrum lipolyticum DSM 21995]